MREHAMALPAEMNKVNQRMMRIFNGNSHYSTAPFELNGGGRFVLSRKDFVPAYVRAFEEGILQQHAAEAIEALRSCRVCPRDCEIDRFNNKTGVCKSGRLARFRILAKKTVCAAGTDRARFFSAGAICAVSFVKISRRASSAKAPR